MSGLDEITAAIWPGGTVVRGTGTERYVVLPSLDRPRLLVPLGAPQAAASVIRFSVEAGGWRARIRRRMLAVAFRTGVGACAFPGRLAVRVPERGLQEHLRAVLGAPVRLGVQLGPARANRKPVAPVLGPRGELIGFAKLAVNDLTGRLVSAEGDALDTLARADLGRVCTASVLHRGMWNGHPLLVQSALPVWRARAKGSAVSDGELAAMLAVARCLGTRTLVYSGSPFAQGQEDAVAALGDRSEARRLALVLDHITRSAPILTFGAWHGDWNHGNSAVLVDGRVLVWDWERFGEDVPVGFDALHRTLHTAVSVTRVEPRVAAEQLLSTAPALLEPFGVTAHATTVAVLYLVELATRYLRDQQAEAGARLGRIAEWLLPAVERRMRITETLQGGPSPCPP